MNLATGPERPKTSIWKTHMWLRRRSRTVYMCLLFCLQKEFAGQGGEGLCLKASSKSVTETPGANSFCFAMLWRNSLRRTAVRNQRSPKCQVLKTVPREQAAVCVSYSWQSCSLHRGNFPYLLPYWIPITTQEVVKTRITTAEAKMKKLGLALLRRFLTFLYLCCYFERHPAPNDYPRLRVRCLPFTGWRLEPKPTF